MRSCLLTLLTTSFLLGAAGAKDDAKADHENIQGTWQVVSAELGGVKQVDEAIKDYKWVITKDKIAMKFAGMTTEVSYELEATKKPKWIDLSDTTSLGIYELEGDNLKVCFIGEPKAKRPTAFESKPDSVNKVLIILKREKP